MFAHSHVPGMTYLIKQLQMVQRCGLWQIKRMTSQDKDKDQVSMKIFLVFGLFTNEVLKMPEMGQECKFWIWFVLVMSRLSLLFSVCE